MKHSRMRSLLGIAPLLAFTLALSIVIWACSGEDTSVTQPRLDQTTTYAANLPEFAAAIQVHNRHIPDILNTPNVAGTAVGADAHGKPIIYVYTKELLPPGQLKQDYEGYRVVQQVTGPIEPKKGPPPMGGGGGGDDPKALQSPPVKMGTSGGWRYDLANGYCCGGTLGSLIQIGGNKYILSNYHVLYADIVSGGNGRVASAGDPVIQPGLIDVSCQAGNAQNVGTLVNNGGSLPGHNFDSGIALANSNVDQSGAILNIGTISSSTVGASVGQAVKKMGRTTGLARASITAVNGAFSITYENECAGGTSFTQSYTNQIVVSNDRCNFLDGGDSGSLMVEDVDTNPRAVGLLFAGSTRCNKTAIAIANPINSVLSYYGASMVGN